MNKNSTDPPWAILDSSFVTVLTAKMSVSLSVRAVGTDVVVMGVSADVWLAENKVVINKKKGNIL